MCLFWASRSLRSEHWHYLPHDSGVREVGGIRKYEQDEFEKRELVRQLSGLEIVSGNGLN